MTVVLPFMLRSGISCSFSRKDPTTKYTQHSERRMLPVLKCRSYSGTTGRCKRLWTRSANKLPMMLFAISGLSALRRSTSRAKTLRPFSSSTNDPSASPGRYWKSQTVILQNFRNSSSPIWYSPTSDRNREFEKSCERFSRTVQTSTTEPHRSLRFVEVDLQLFKFPCVLSAGPGGFRGSPGRWAELCRG